MGDFKMPSLGADMEVGTIIEWRVKRGDTVHRGDIVAVVDTEKSDIEVEIFDDGVIEQLVVEPGIEVPVGTVLAHLAPISAPAAVALPEAPVEPKARKGREPVHGERRRHPPAAAPVVRASPLARRRAAEQGVDLGTIAGSGPGGAVLATDLGRAVPVAPAPRKAVGDRHAAARHATGVVMARSKQEIPHYYLATTIDMGPALVWLAETNTARPVTERLLPAALLLKATALAAREIPIVNGWWDEEFQPASAVHLGLAVSLRGGGLVAPAIHDADRLELSALMDALRDLVARARTGTLRSSEMSDASITVTNLGDQGVEEVFGVIYPPQVALVGFGRIVERPWASAGMLGVRPVVRATLSADHRVSDGTRAPASSPPSTA
jgi:pyruvate dehydrogenase E2 component (dihydrolipoamide acetyltransferase)